MKKILEYELGRIYDPAMAEAILMIERDADRVGMVLIPSDPIGKARSGYIRSLAQKYDQLLVAVYPGALEFEAAGEVMKVSLPDLEGKLKVAPVDGNNLRAAFEHPWFKPNNPIEVHGDPSLGLEQEKETQDLGVDPGMVQVIEEPLPPEDPEKIKNAILQPTQLIAKQVLDPHVFSDAEGVQRIRKAIGESLIKESTGPILAYHGSNRRIDQPQALGQVKGAWEALDFGPGMYFSTNARDAREYGMNLYQAELVLSNPLRISDQMTPEMDRFRKAFRISDEDIEMSEGQGLWHGIMGYVVSLIQMGMYSKGQVMAFLKKMGHDGIIVPAPIVRESGAKVTGDYVIIFDVSQIQNWAPVSREVFQSTNTRSESLQLEFLKDISPSNDKEEGATVILQIVDRYSDLLRKRGVDIENMRFLGKGNNGLAWELADKRVLKVTTDDAEANVGMRLKGKKFKHIFEVHDVWAFPGQYNGHHVYGLITEPGLIKPSMQERKAFHQMISILIDDENGQPDDQLRDMLETGDLKPVLQNMMTSRLRSPQQKRDALNWVKEFNLPGICADAKRMGVAFDMHAGNIMKRGTDYVIIDIGTGGDQEAQKPPFAEQRINEVGITAAPQSNMRGYGGYGTKSGNGNSWAAGMEVLRQPDKHVPEDENSEYRPEYGAQGNKLP